MKTAAVIPVGAGRRENLLACLFSIRAAVHQPDVIVVVCDGEVGIEDQDLAGCYIVRPKKHEPGREQPRNRGVRAVQEIDTLGADPFTHVWFLDSDILVADDCYAAYLHAMMANPTDRVLVGPYEWLPTGVRETHPEMKNDGRWASFEEHAPDEVITEDLSAGLACFGGNLIWPIEDFVRIGGFWDALYHGRCEDGELGLRAVACGIGISLVAGARGYHLDHPVNHELKLERNERDVPMLNARHPWVQGEGLFVVEEDGKRFNAACSCGWTGNTAEVWAHRASCKDGRYEANSA